MKKNKNCKHKFHLLIQEDNSEVSYQNLGIAGVFPIIEPATKFYVVFVCEYCGKLKKVEIQNE